MRCPNSTLGRGTAAFCFTLLLSAFLSGLSAQIPAFPGAEGFGAYATGGRGGDVYYVTNTNNNGAGSLREGLNTAPPEGRTIVFAVSGYIPVNSDTSFDVPDNVTIAGQTAPGDGVGLRGGRMLISGSNVVMRHFRVRHGRNGTGGDCINIAGSASDTILDHVSMMFSTDENFSFFSNAINNFTMQSSSSTWGMERHNAGGLWDLRNGSCIDSLWAHHKTRNPKARPYGVLEWINNVTFHWRGEGFIMGDSETPADWKTNAIGNYYISIEDPDDGFGLKSDAFVKGRVSRDGVPNFSLFLDDTLFDNNDNGLLDGTDRGYGIVEGTEFTPGDPVGSTRYYKAASPFPGATGAAAVSIDDPRTAYKKVVSSVGPLRLDANFAGRLRDELDSLLIDSVVNQYSVLVQKDGKVDGEDPDRPNNGEQHLADEYGISNNGFGTLNSTAAPDDADLDGMPDYWEGALGWDPLAQDHNVAMASSRRVISGTTFFPADTPAGYTRLEEYLHFKAIPHATIAADSFIDVDLSRYTDGFTAPMEFSIENEVNCTVVVQADDKTVRITPTPGHAGRSRFEFAVTDAEGDSWTQTFGLLATYAFSPPAAPSGLSASAASSYRINLNWTDHANNETGFRLDRSTDGVNFTEIAELPADSTSFSDEPLSPDTNFFYRVWSYNSEATSSYIEVSASTPAGPPAPPSGLTAAPGDSRATLTWNASPGAAYYTIKRASTAGGAYTSVGTSSSSSFADDGLSNHRSYSYVVSASNAYGTSGNSGEASVIPKLHLRLNSGGPAVEPYLADAYYVSGGTYDRSGDPIDTGGVVDPAPEAVYLSERNDDFSYLIDGLQAGNYYLLRLHFAEIFHGSDGDRVFDLFINGEEVLSDFDIHAETGARYQAMVRDFTVLADGSGELEVQFVTVVDNAKVSAVELLSMGQPEPVSPLAWYRFENGSAGSAVPAGGDQIVDAAGGDDNMNAFGVGEAPGFSGSVPETTVPQTHDGNALSTYYDGSDSLYNRISAGPVVSTVYSDFSIEAYVNFESLDGFQTIVGRDDTAGNTSGGVDGNPQALLYLSKHMDGHFRVEVSTAGGDLLAVESSVFPDAGTWYHLAAVGDGNAGTLTLYVNGENAGSVEGFDGLYPTTSLPWTIGRGMYDGSQVDNVSGYIDEVRIFDVALSRPQFLIHDPDSDNDGLRDAWELKYFKDLSQSGEGDPDDDGETNKVEESNGTDPTISSIPPGIGVFIEGGMLQLSWPGNRTGWVLMSCTDLVDGDWQEVPGSDAVNFHEEALEGDVRFYRLEYPE